MTAQSTSPIDTPTTAAARGEFSAIIVTALLGEYSLLIMPFIVTAMIQSHGLDESRAGQYVSLQLAAMGVAGCAAPYLMRRVSFRPIVFIAAVFVMAANMVCALAGDSTTLALGRVVTGLGEGSLMAVAGAMAAGIADSHRLFSMLGFVIAVVAAAALLAAPVLLQDEGATSVFWLLAGSPVAALIAVTWLPRRSAPAPDALRLSVLRIPGAFAALSAFALMWFGASAMWVYAEQIGSAQGLTLGQVGTYLAVGQVAGVLGPILAARFGERFDLRLSLATGSVLMAAAALMMVFGRTPVSYGGGASLLSIGVMFLAPCYRSLMARLDGTGAVVAMSVAFYTAGFGIAPLLISGAQSSHGYGRIAWWGCAAFVASGVISLLIHPVGHRAEPALPIQPQPSL